MPLRWSWGMLHVCFYKYSAPTEAESLFAEPSILLPLQKRGGTRFA